MAEPLTFPPESFQESNRCHSRQPVGAGLSLEFYNQRGCVVYTNSCVISQKMLCPQKTPPDPTTLHLPAPKKSQWITGTDKQTMEGPRPNKNRAPRLAAAPYLLRSNATFRDGSACPPFRAGNRPESTLAYVTC